MIYRELYNPLNGRLTTMNTHISRSYEDAKPQEVCPYWSSTEGIATYAWVCRFSDGNLYGSSYKINGCTVRPVAFITFAV